MADTPGTRFLQVKAASRHGAQPFSQASDGTGTPTHYAVYADDGSLTDGPAPTTGVIMTSGTPSWYGQVPRGPQNGSNTTFYLDYTLANPYPNLVRNGVSLIPPIDGPGANSVFEYSITGNILTFVVAPKVTDWIYIWYFIDTASGIPAVSAATVYVWTAFSGGSAPHDYATSTFTYPGGGSSAGVYNNNAFYSLQQNSLSLTLPGSPTIDSFSGASVQFVMSGALNSTGDPNYFDIYDVYIVLTLVGGSTVTIRPTSYLFWSGGDGSTYSWQPNFSYSSGVTIIDGNGNLQISTTTGTSGPWPGPVWAGSGNTTDGGQVWSFVSAQTSTTGKIENATQAYDVDASTPATFARIVQTSWGLTDDGNLTLNF